MTNVLIPPMSLKRKITLSFLISALIIALLTGYVYNSFIKIRRELRNLELADTIRSKSLQLRRHEKNYFLYGSRESHDELEAIHRYIKELDDIIGANEKKDGTRKLIQLRELVGAYQRRFLSIELSISRLLVLLDKTGSHYSGQQAFFRHARLTFRERPHLTADLIQSAFPLPDRHPLIRGLLELDQKVQLLRKTGVEIIQVSNQFDKTARGKAENVIESSQTAILVIFPLFFLIGIGTLFLISHNLVRRLTLLIDTVEQAGYGKFKHIPISLNDGGDDEIGVLIQKFNIMKDRLIQRESELEIKNQELVHAKKFAAIGSLASGVAHELNNPLNNISLSAQVLSRELGHDSSPTVREVMDDIIGQTKRVKEIVGDLLEFARGRDPQFQRVKLEHLFESAYRQVSKTQDCEEISFAVECYPASVEVSADAEQLERVFINLFANAVTAMEGAGRLNVTVSEGEKDVVIRVTDTGKGIAEESLDIIFEPFYTTRDKGTGLGLAIVFNIIKKHNGGIQVESEINRGTSFLIHLPAFQEESVADPAITV